MTTPDERMRVLLAALTAERFQPIPPPLPVKVRPATPAEIDAAVHDSPRLTVVEGAA